MNNGVKYLPHSSRIREFLAHRYPLEVPPKF